MNPTLEGVTVLNNTLKLMTQVKDTQPGHFGDKHNKAIRDILVGASVGIVSRITELNRDFGINSKGLREFNGRYSYEDYRIPYKEFNWSSVYRDFQSSRFLLKETIVDKKKAEEFATLLTDLKILSEGALSNYDDKLKYELTTPQSISWIVEEKQSRNSESKTFQLNLFTIESLSIKYDGDITFEGQLYDPLGHVRNHEVELDGYSTDPHMLPLIEPLCSHIQSALTTVIQNNTTERELLEQKVQVFVTKYGHHAVLANL